MLIAKMYFFRKLLKKVITIQSYLFTMYLFKKLEV